MVLRFFLLAIILAGLQVPVKARAEDRFVAIAYHDVVRTKDELASDAVTLDHLIDQFEWLLANKYRPVSIDDLILADKGDKPLPSRAVLLCWDDGYRSFYDLVFPLLKAYGFPAVLAIEGAWMETPADEDVVYGSQKIVRSKFLSWSQLSEIAASGLVEIASHSFDLHKGVLADAAGDMLPAVSAHIYDLKTGDYESDAEHYSRIFNDLKKNSDLLQEKLGRKPRVMVWPFGRYNKSALQAAHAAGMDITLTLNPVPGNIHNLREIGRIYPTQNPVLADFKSYLDLNSPPEVHHFFTVGTADLIDISPGTETRFSKFLDRLNVISPGQVGFEPVIFSNTGMRAIFPNNTIPVYQDRLNRLSWHTGHRGGTAVYLWFSSQLFSDSRMNDPLVATDFFHEMGKFGHCAGIVLDLPDLLPDLMLADMDQVARQDTNIIWDPDRSRKNRQQLLQSGGDSRLAKILGSLESFQHWQPFEDVVLVVSADRISELNRNTVATLLKYFDFLLIAFGADTTEAQLVAGLHQLSNQLRGSDLMDMIGLFFRYNIHGQDISQPVTRALHAGFFNYGYANDDFFNNVPAAQKVRPFFSREVFPFRR